jgi:hypothetical protein
MNEALVIDNTAGVPIRYSTSILTDKERERILQQAEEVKRSGGRLGIEQSERNPGSLYIKIWR